MDASAIDRWVNELFVGVCVFRTRRAEMPENPLHHPFTDLT